MPLARITTPLPEYCERLAQDLRARGFDVETAASGQFFSAAADLEITVRQCRPDEAAKMAADASGRADMCVLVTPGARDGGIRSIEMIVLQPDEATQAARNWVTPAQVIEISSALIASDSPRVPEVISKRDEKPTTGRAVKVRVLATWEDIVETTIRWMDGATASLHTGGAAAKRSVVPLKAFLLEIGSETRKLTQRIAASIIPGRRGKAADQEQLVPSMFSLADDEEPEVFTDEELSAIELPELRQHRFSWRDGRFLKASGAAAVAALAVLFAVSIMHRSAPSSSAPVSSQVKTTGTPSATPKPSALVGEGKPRSGMRMLAAKQVFQGDPEAEDTVVRYTQRPAAPKRAEIRSGVKRYSDLD
jgi:hypothetical protein